MSYYLSIFGSQALCRGKDQTHCDASLGIRRVFDTVLVDDAVIFKEVPGNSGDVSHGTARLLFGRTKVKVFRGLLDEAMQLCYACGGWNRNLG